MKLAKIILISLFLCFSIFAQARGSSKGLSFLILSAKMSPNSNGKASDRLSFRECMLNKKCLGEKNALGMVTTANERNRNYSVEELLHGVERQAVIHSVIDFLVPERKMLAPIEKALIGHYSLVVVKEDDSPYSEPSYCILKNRKVKNCHSKVSREAYKFIKTNYNFFKSKTNSVIINQKRASALYSCVKMKVTKEREDAANGVSWNPKSCDAYASIVGEKGIGQELLVGIDEKVLKPIAKATRLIIDSLESSE